MIQETKISSWERLNRWVRIGRPESDKLWLATCKTYYRKGLGPKEDEKLDVSFWHTESWFESVNRQRLSSAYVFDSTSLLIHCLWFDSLTGRWDHKCQIDEWSSLCLPSNVHVVIENTSADNRTYLNTKLQNVLVNSENHTVNMPFAKCQLIVSDFIVPLFPHQ